MQKFPEDFGSESFQMDDFDSMEESLKKVREHNPELAKNLKDEIERAALNPDEEVLIVGTEGDYTITVFLVPESVIGGLAGPVLMPSSDEKKILAAVSRERVQKKADKCLSIPDPLLAQQEWQKMVDWFFDKTVEEIKLGRVEFIPDEFFENKEDGK